MKHTFLCESDSQKLEFLKRAFPDAGHIFTDMVDVAKGRAKDHLLDGQWQTVPEARTLVMGMVIFCDVQCNDWGTLQNLPFELKGTELKFLALAARLMAWCQDFHAPVRLL